MVDFTPTAHVIPWIVLLNKSLTDFFKDFESSFRRNEKGLYVFADKFQKVKIKKWFFEKISLEIDSILKSLDMEAPSTRVYVIDTCKVNDNVFANKMEKYNLAYSFVEEDIHLDMVKLEDIFDRCFNQYFTGKISLGKNVVFLKNSFIDFSTIRDGIKSIYGKKLYVEIPFSEKQILFDVNDKIDKNDKSKRISADFYFKELKETLIERNLFDKK